MTRLAGGRPRLTRRGRVASRIAIVAAFTAAAITGLTANSWNPCSQPTTVCVIERTAP